ncbi:hypothetical protein OG288_15780 [Streptomyces tauricus]|uniref:Lsr2-like protein n=1 Tax=Streptomyces tauricus TaxID=68274 RepID=A0ABZ1JEE8_9ACTN|nr:hypothetical protein [Streptomyces tauricus]
MAKVPVQVTEDDYKADPEKVQRIETQIPGMPDASPIVNFIRVDYVDDVTGKPAEGIETVQILVPVEAEREETVIGEDGEPEKNGDGSNKLQAVKYMDFERRELDLSPASLKKLQTALKPFAEKSRLVRVQARPAVAAKKTASGPNPELTEWRRRVRTWLMNDAPASVTHGEKVPDRGVLKGAWEAAYVEKHPQDPKPE